MKGTSRIISRWAASRHVAVTVSVALGILAHVCAEETLPQLKVGNDVYTNVTVTMVTATSISLNHSRGMAVVKLKNLEPAMQQHFGYVPEKAMQAELNQQQANAQYRAMLASREPASASAANSTSVQATNAESLHWHVGLPGALQRAKTENKCVLLLFDGSDWCPASAWVNRNILSKDDFRAYAREHLLLVLVDFPKHLPQSDELKAANAKLSERFNIHYYPTFVLLNSDGKNLGGTLGTRLVSSKAFIDKLEKFRSQ
jgi:protein disulfide-isomerase